MICYHATTKELRELPDSLLADWAAAENPKLDLWIPAPEKPRDDANWIDGAWVIPEPIVPPTVTISARQIRLWLIRQGIALAAVDAAIEAIPDQMTRETVQVEWEYAPYVERSHPMLIPLAAALGLTEDQVDQAFIEAALI
jgi:hypothetical protein